MRFEWKKNGIIVGLINLKDYLSERTVGDWVEEGLEGEWKVFEVKFVFVK